jgi:NADPH2:quinone reductase
VAGELRVKAEGSSDASTPAILAQVAALVASGDIVVPIAATYPLDEVRAAYTQLEHRPARAKNVLVA